MRSSWHTAAASVVLPKPPAPLTAVAIATGNRDGDGASSQSMSAANSRSRATKFCGSAGAMKGTRAAWQPRCRCATNLGHSRSRS